MGRRWAVFLADLLSLGIAAEAVEERLQLVASGDDDADADNTDVEELPKIVQVTHERLVLAVPLDFKAHAPLETIDLVSLTLYSRAINDVLDFELALFPAATIQLAIQVLRN